MSEADDVTVAQAAAMLGLADDHPARQPGMPGGVYIESESETRELSRDEAQEIRDSWEAEHQRQLAAIHEREIAAAGNPANVDGGGVAHFVRMQQTAENPPAWSEGCGGCGATWPCEPYMLLHPAPAGPPKYENS